MVWFLIVIVPVVQLTVKVTVVPPAGTFTVWGLALVTVNVYPSRSRFEPVVVVVTVRVPVVAVAVQLTANVVEPVPPAGTVTVRGFAPLTVQLDGTPLS